MGLPFVSAVRLNRIGKKAACGGGAIFNIVGISLDPVVRVFRAHNVEGGSSRGTRSDIRAVSHRSETSICPCGSPRESRKEHRVTPLPIGNVVNTEKRCDGEFETRNSKCDAAMGAMKFRIPNSEFRIPRDSFCFQQFVAIFSRSVLASSPRVPTTVGPAP